ncbi:MAG: cell division protein FtsZ [Ignavibacteria bacterium]|nr:cell division protein FtsZ [Ignavibacteria bacterium]MBK7446333.1 cell division protein FtsZ [Ignavibacteria bacterium]MBK9405186.1 cell division protein FtsZ [Ignavibacteria bacterium]
MPIRLAINNHTGAKIKVVGVGGGGGNVLNSMVDKGIEGVEFIAVNTDAQALDKNKAEVKIQIGKSLTKGLGTGMDSMLGYKAAEESRNEIEEALSGSDMVFITAGLGGGTGTGGAPAVARIAKSQGALVVAIVTLPFNFECKPRMDLALEGLEKLKSEVDSLIAIPNQNITKLISKDASSKQAFELADRVLYNATRGISKIITDTGDINVDFADVRTIMKDTGDAMIGSGIASGDGRAQRAANDALVNPVLDEIHIEGSKCVLTNICSNGNVSFSEIEKINEIIQEAAGEDAKYIFGLVEDPKMSDEIMVTVIATGFSKKEEVKVAEHRVIVGEPFYGGLRTKGKISVMPSGEELKRLDGPAYERREVNLNEDLSENISKPKIYEEENDFIDINPDEDFSKPSFLRRQMD